MKDLTGLLGSVKKYTEVLATTVEDEPDAHNVFLVVGGQRFCVTTFACSTKLDAEWMQIQLCMALTKIIEEVGSI